MTDREMLELAAKAFWGADIDDCCSVRWLEVDQAIGYTHADNQDHNGEDQERVWNPLDDDGDALRLAVKLGMRVYVYPGHGDDYTIAACDVAGGWARVEHGADPYAATRRTIVRAAAEIGRAMP